MTKRSGTRAVIASAIAVSALIAGISWAVAAPAWTPKKTAWGDPDLRGTWPLDSVARTPFQRPPQYGDQAFLTDAEYAAALKNAADLGKKYGAEEKAGKLSVGHWTEYGEPSRQTSLIVEPANGRLPPMTPEGERLAAGMKSSWTKGAVFDSMADFNSLDRCITRGLPASMVPFPYNNGVRIFQGPGYVAIQLEIVHETRIIPLDGRAPPPGQANWLGASRGHFEGDTLVIDTTNFNGASPMVIVGPTNQPVPTTRNMHIVERLTPTGPNTLQYEATISDPDVLTAPWKMSFPWTRNDKYKLYEYACHEGNVQLAGYIKGTSPRFAEYRKTHQGVSESALALADTDARHH